MKITIPSKAGENQERHAHLEPLISWLIEHGHVAENGGKPIDARSHQEIIFNKLFDVDAIKEEFALPDTFTVNRYQILDRKNVIFLTTTRNSEEIKERPLFSDLSMFNLFNGER